MFVIFIMSGEVFIAQTSAYAYTTKNIYQNDYNWVNSQTVL